MVSEKRLPPSGRDFDAYTRVVVELLSTREAAREFGISQTRVCQVVVRVGEYLQQVSPPGVAEEDRGRQVYLAQQIAAEQVRYFLRQALEAFDRSIGKQTVVREVDTQGKPKSTISTTKISCGDIRYLNQAAKLALLGAKLPAPNLAGLLPDEEDEEAGSDQIVHAELVAGPPDEDCSLAAGEEADEESEDDAGDDANPDYDDSSELLSAAEATEFHAQLRADHPVQLRQQLVKMGVREEEMEDFLSSPYGQKAIREYEEVVSGLLASVTTTN